MVYSLHLVPIDELSANFLILYIFVLLVFFLSALAHHRSYSRVVWARRKPVSIKIRTLWMLHFIGFLGLYRYVSDFSADIGGIGNFFNAFLYNSSAIRALAVDHTSIGFQLSYFGWIAIVLTVLADRVEGENGGVPVLLWLASLIQFIGNFLFIDRTRPIWIIFLLAMAWLYSIKKPFLSKILIRLFVLLVLFLAVFMVVALWTGKMFSGGGINEIYIYVAAGLPYFDALTKSGQIHDYLPVRNLYPIFKVLHDLGIYKVDVPNQILPFLKVPFETNVGTFLEPLYSDGGWFYVVCGTVFFVFWFDSLALFALQTRCIFGVFLWCNICFSWAISFFVPKYVTFPFWLFVFLFIMESLLRGRIRIFPSRQSV
ncbi:hypothetical protein [Pandoraea thiooxydans]|nr:hypothetical protein [Pandoraea thiooxydans]